MKTKKAINSRAKGKRIEKEARLILESQGWLVEQCNPKLMFIGPGKVISKAHDFFGRWDFLCVVLNQVLFVQVSVWEAKSDKIKQIQGFPLVGRQEIWLWVSQGKNSHFKILKREDDWGWHGDLAFKVKK